MQISTAEGVTTAIGTEEPPPPPKNVRVGRRGVAGGLTALVAYLLLTMYAWGNNWAPHEGVAFARTCLALGMLAGLGVALYGYGMHKSDRTVAAAKAEAEEARFQREQWELAQFDSLHDADSECARALRDMAATLDATRRELRELRTLVAEHDLRAAPRQRPRRRRSDQSSTPGEAAAAKKAKQVAGYLADVRGRLGASGPDLRVVRVPGED